MSDDSEEDRSAAEEERIRKWREERLAVAEREKAERLRARDAERAEQQATLSAGLRDEASAILPGNEEIERARREWTLRRRKRRLAARAGFGLFVLLPTLLCYLYLDRLAVPLYAADSVVVVSNQSDTSGTQMNGIFSALGGGGQSQIDAYMAHEYIQSKALMEDLEAELGLVTRFSGDAIDPVYRLRALPIIRAGKHDLFRRFVRSSINVTTGLISLQVRAPSQKEAVEISQVVISRTADRINDLSDALFERRVNNAQEAVDNARDMLTGAQAALTRLQIDSGEQNPQVRISGIYETIRQLEAEALQLRNRIQLAEIAGTDQNTQTKLMVETEQELRSRIDELRAELVATGNDQDGLNTLVLDFELAALEVRIAEETLSTSLLAFSDISREAALGRSLFQVVVPPRTAENSTYPKPLQTTLVVFGVLAAVFTVLRVFRMSA